MSSGLNDEIVHANKGVIAEITGADEDSIPDIRYFRYFMSQVSVEFLYDADDPDLLAFVQNVRKSMRGLTTSTNAVYDVLTGEPLRAFSTRPESIRWQRRCALEENLYLGPNASTGNRVEFIGPNPRLLKKWREEAGLPYGRKTDPRLIKTLDRLTLRKEELARNSKRLPKEIGPTW